MVALKWDEDLIGAERYKVTCHHLIKGKRDTYKTDKEKTIIIFYFVCTNKTKKRSKEKRLSWIPVLSKSSDNKTQEVIMLMGLVLPFLSHCILLSC